MKLFGLVYIVAEIFIVQTSEPSVFRRILNGEDVEKTLTMSLTTHQYLVYLISADNKFEDWTCGGAIIKEDWILSSAACLLDVEKLYVIYGYAKKVEQRELGEDTCTNSTKKQIIRVCTPQIYEPLEKPTKLKLRLWSKVDIGLGMVDSPFDFGVVPAGCDWKPAKIDMNLIIKGPVADTDAFIFGWGSKDKMRADRDLYNPNSNTLQTARVRLEEKRVCQKAFSKYKMDTVIAKYMLCSQGTGNVNYKGEFVKPEGYGEVDIEGCTLDEDKKKCYERIQAMKLLRIQNMQNQTNDELTIKGISHNTLSNIDRSNTESFNNSTIEGDFLYSTLLSRREEENNTGTTLESGFCQNDHGGPLVTWVGGKQMVIGVISAFKMDHETRMCIPPFLYTSTYCNSVFIKCVLGMTTDVTTPKPPDVTTTKSPATTTTKKKPKVFRELPDVTTDNWQDFLRSLELRALQPGPGNDARRDGYDDQEEYDDVEAATNDDVDAARSNDNAICNSPAAVKGFDIVDKSISWSDY